MRRQVSTFVAAFLQVLSFSMEAHAQNACGLLCNDDWMTNASYRDVMEEAERATPIDGETPEGWTALGYVAGWGQAGAMKVLLGRGADPHHQDQLGDTPYNFALMSGQPYGAFILVLAGADPFKSGSDGIVPLAHAQRISLEVPDGRLEEFFLGMKFERGLDGYFFDTDPEFTLRMWSKFGFDRNIDIPMLDLLARSGNSNAAAYLSIIYSAGKEIPIDADLAVFYANMAKTMGQPRAVELVEFAERVRADVIRANEEQLQIVLDSVDNRYKFASDGRLIQAQILLGQWNDPRSELIGGLAATVLPVIGTSFECKALMRPEVLNRFFDLSLAAADRLKIPRPSRDLCFITEWEQLSGRDLQVVAFYSDKSVAEVCLTPDSRSSVFSLGIKERNSVCGNVFAFLDRVRPQGYLFAVWSSKVGNSENLRNDYEACLSNRLEVKGEMFYQNEVPTKLNSNFITVGSAIDYLVSGPEGKSCLVQ